MLSDVPVTMPVLWPSPNNCPLSAIISTIAIIIIIIILAWYQHTSVLVPCMQ